MSFKNRWRKIFKSEVLAGELSSQNNQEIYALEQAKIRQRRLLMTPSDYRDPIEYRKLLANEQVSIQEDISSKKDQLDEKKTTSSNKRKQTSRLLGIN